MADPSATTTKSPPPQAAPGAPRPDAWAAFRRALVGFDRGGLSLWRGARNAIAVALPLCAGALAQRPLPALIVATGALNVCFADGIDPFPRRIRRMLGAAVFVGLAVFCGACLGATLPGALGSAAVWAFGTGMALCLGVPVGNVAVSSLCVLLIFAARPMPPPQAALSGGLAMVGGLLTVGISSLLRPRRGLEPERRALAELYLELAELPGRPVQTSRSPPASSKASAAREATDAMAMNHSLAAERYRALLDQAERSRFCLLTLRALRERARNHEQGEALTAMVDDFLTAAGRAFHATGEALYETRRGGRSILADVPADAHPAAQAEEILARFRERTAGGTLPTLTADIGAQMDALTRQLRVTFALATNATPAGGIAFARREGRQSWKLRLNGAVGTIRANLSLRSAVFRHAIRLSVCLTAGDALAHALAEVLGWNRPYWLPLTIAVVLKPDFSSTFSRGVLRLAGTFAGLGVATALFHILPQGLPVEIALIALITFLLRWAGPANYGVLAMNVSALVVLLVAITGVTPAGVIVARAENTAIGGVLALLAYWLWPTWERTQVNEAFARVLQAYCRHWELLGRMYAAAGSEEEDSALTAAMDRTRMQARLERSNLEASVDRLAAEPGTTMEQMGHWHAMLASSHIFAHSAIMLEAHRLARAEGTPPPAIDGTFQDFIDAVADTFTGLIALLRGAGVEQMPDLREAHRRLVHSGAAETARHTLISVETDKIVNSLNTLREQIAALAGAG